MSLSFHPCWVCNSKTLVLFKKNNLNKTLTSSSFAITDSSYGETTTLGKCTSCNFIQSVDDVNVIEYYNDLEDNGYEDSRKERSLQSKKILAVIKKIKQEGELLDVGAGSGILVEQALLENYHAIGVEPSIWLQKKAAERNLPVIQGVIPHEEITRKFNIITLVDVIEHINNPYTLLVDLKQNLYQDGILVIITPDAGSFTAKILGGKWWHFRIAHIGYFNKNNLNKLLTRAGYTKVSVQYATWYFSVEYLFERLKKYLPFLSLLPLPPPFKKITIPLNLRDSIFAIYKLE